METLEEASWRATVAKISLGENYAAISLHWKIESAAVEKTIRAVAQELTGSRIVAQDTRHFAVLSSLLNTRMARGADSFDWLYELFNDDQEGLI